MKTVLLLLAAGSGSRMGLKQNKVFLSLGGKSVLQRSMEAFVPFADEIIVLHRPGEEEAAGAETEKVPFSGVLRLVPGGADRQDSVENGLSRSGCRPEDLILIHDSARCLVSPGLIRRVRDAALEKGASIPGLPATNTIKVCREDQVLQTPDRSLLYEIQTPQACRADWLLQAFARARGDGFRGTDDASLLEHAGFPVAVVRGERNNIKLTTGEDIRMAESILGLSRLPRVGHGYDVHRFAEDRKLILCGVEIPWEKGLLGHSDADVAVHALMDAMLGAAGLGDIGLHFPDTDPRYEGISSLLLLKETVRLLQANGYELLNADLTIAAQKPKLRPYIARMTETLAAALGVDPSRLNVKATTTEGLGFEGRMEGISAQAVCLILPVTAEGTPAAP
ncbi:MAG: 2-C-methyl-D-erythritol 2,4-cyclodiphosphate synthase [Clostridia bacterium]|nr:2-C-methyl-D-erythritol 2,4-cyclodiphosphate synthase [Clostridia bacterium]